MVIEYWILERIFGKDKINLFHVLQTNRKLARSEIEEYENINLTTSKGNSGITLRDKYHMRQ